MPIQSRMIASASASDADYSVIPHIPTNATLHPAVLAQVLGANPLTMTLQPQHIHTLSSEQGIFAIDTEIANALYTTVALMFTQIHRAGSYKTHGYIDYKRTHPSQLPAISAHLFTDAGLPIPPVLELVQFYTQNPILSANTWEGIFRAFSFGQNLGMQTAEWMAKARLICATRDDQFGWNWEGLEVEKQLCILGPTAYNALINAPAAIASENTSKHCRHSFRFHLTLNLIDSGYTVKDVILHPRYSRWIKDHPRYNPFDSFNYDTVFGNNTIPNAIPATNDTPNACRTCDQSNHISMPCNKPAGTPFNSPTTSVIDLLQALQYVSDDSMDSSEDLTGGRNEDSMDESSDEEWMRSE